MKIIAITNQKGRVKNITKALNIILLNFKYFVLEELSKFLFMMYDLRKNLLKEIENELYNFFSKKIFKTKMPKNVKIVECFLMQSIYVYLKRSNDAKYILIKLKYLEDK